MVIYFCFYCIIIAYLWAKLNTALSSRAFHAIISRFTFKKHMRFKVPQDVQREDTIIGPITLKQLIILGIGGTITYTTYLSLVDYFEMIIWIWPVGILGITTASFAFIKIHNLSFTQYLLHFTEYTLVSKRRAWQQGMGDVYISQLAVVKKSKEELEAEEKLETSKEKIEDLDKISAVLDIHHKK